MYLEQKTRNWKILDFYTKVCRQSQCAKQCHRSFLLFFKCEMLAVRALQTLKMRNKSLNIKIILQEGKHSMCQAELAPHSLSEGSVSLRTGIIVVNTSGNFFKAQIFLTIWKVQTHFRPEKHHNVLWKSHPLQRWSATSCPDLVQSMQGPCEHSKVAFPICGYRYFINWWYVLGIHRKIRKLSSLFLCHFSLFFFIQLHGNCAVELQNTAEEQESLYGQALPLTLSYFHQVKEIT